MASYGIQQRNARKKPKPQQAVARTLAPDEADLETQALKFIDEAETDRRLQWPWQQDFYRYCVPWRRRPGYWTRVNDQDDLFNSTAIEALGDFASDMQLAFTPVDEDWLKYAPEGTLSQADQAQIKAPLQAYQDAVFSSVRRSNFHEASQESYLDLGAGTCGIVIQDYDISRTIQCLAVPITDMLLVRGQNGGIDFKAREIVGMKLRDIEPTYGAGVIDDRLAARIQADPSATVWVHECYWRLWDRDRVERWQYCLLIDRAYVGSAVLQGAGSCPLIVARWRTDSTTAWGIGPIYWVLPTIKTLDQLDYLALKNLSMAVDPPGFYDDDGVVNLENGITPGMWIPRATGSKIEPLETGTNFDTTFFSRTNMEQIVKRSLYQDKPVQRGDTPPTAAQWMDQKAETSRRMGAPIGRLTTEWQIPIVDRFAHILKQRGKLPKVELNGEKMQIKAASPLVKQMQQQKVVLAQRFVETVQGMVGPEFAPMIIEPVQTTANIKDALGDTLVELQDPQQVQQMMQQAAQAAAGQPQRVASPPSTQQATIG